MIKMAQSTATATTETQNDEKRLQDIFALGWNIYDELQDSSLSSSSSEFQKKVLQSMEQFEKATEIVSQIGMFSDNELIDELPTASLQYLLLPFFLGKMAIQLVRTDRNEIFRVAEIYFKDYLQRCEEYELCETEKQKENDDKNETAVAENKQANSVELLVQSAQARNKKIMQFQQKKKLDEYIHKWKSIVRSNAIDDEVKREFFLKLIERCILEAKDELKSLELEKQVWQMLQMRKTANEESAAAFDSSVPDTSNHANHHRGHAHMHQQQQKAKPLEPFIITRNNAQKSVYGLGYPSLPVMSVNDFYQQRVHEGIFPDEEKMAKMQQEKMIAALENPEQKEEEDKEAVDRQVDEDDPEYLARMRRMDEYKDVVRRGDGNRYNRS